MSALERFAFYEAASKGAAVPRRGLKPRPPWKPPVSTKPSRLS